MNAVEALHTAARRYCRARHDQCWEEYRALVFRLDRVGKGYWRTNQYTEEELAVYPRHLVLWAILKEVERLDPNASVTVEGMRVLLVQIGSTAHDEMTDDALNESGGPAIEDERRRFIEYLGSLSRGKLAAVKPLPFRRILTEDETKVLWSEIQNRWRTTGKWYPLLANAPPQDVVAFHADYFDHEKIEALRGILHERGIRRVFELRGPIAFEIELESFEPRYEIAGGSKRLYGAGCEGYWTGSEKDWLAYVSHECSITLAGGWFLSAFERAVPSCRDFTFLGQISTEDHRGTW